MPALEDFIASTDQLVEFYANFKEKALSDFSIPSLKAYRAELSSLWTDIKTNYTRCLQSETGDDDDSDSATDIIEAAKSKYRSSSDTYISCLGTIISFIEDLELSQPSRATHVLEREPSISGVNAASQSASKNPLGLTGSVANDGIPTILSKSDSFSSVKVPPCDTEVFYGNYLDWPSFRDMFSAIYINNARLSEVQKLFHLRAKTKGDASNIVSKFPLTNANFELAWKALRDHFENRRILVNNQLKILFNLPRVSVESGRAIKKLQTDISDALTALQTEGVVVDNWNCILVYLCSSRLPETTIALWEQTLRDPMAIPLWSDMNTFLTNRYRVLEAIQDIKPKPTLKHGAFKSISNSKSFHLQRGKLPLKCSL